MRIWRRHFSGHDAHPGAAVFLRSPFPTCEGRKQYGAQQKARCMELRDTWGCPFKPSSVQPRLQAEVAQGLSLDSGLPKYFGGLQQRRTVRVVEQIKEMPAYIGIAAHTAPALHASRPHVQR
jgi:hypothetical protein